MARAPSTPSVVDSTAVATPTFSEFHSAFCIASLAAIASYQRVVKPVSGNATEVESLNENSGMNRIGR